MKYLFISDIHSNLDALDSILRKADKLYSDYLTICIGDIVGYGAEPNECMDRVTELTDKIVLGNHDAGVVGKTDIRMFNYSAKEAIIWTKGKISLKNVKKFKEMPYILNEKSFAVVHASSSNPEYWNYIDSIYEAQDEFKVNNYALTFIGHTHIPLVYELKNEDVKMLFDEHIECNDNSRYIVNVGSVGQPRNQDRRACALIYDEEEKRLDYIKADYNIKSAQRKILDAKLPKFLAERLERGL